MKTALSTKTELPLVRLSLLLPWIQELDRCRKDSLPVLLKFDLSRQDLLHNDRFLSVPTMYAIVEELSVCSGDPHFGARVGEKLDPWSWPPVTEAARLSTTVGEFLLRIILNGSQDQSSVVYTMETIGNRTTFGEKRVTQTDIFPRHNDGFTIAWLLTMLKRAIGEHWDGQRVLARLCDPGTLPNGYYGIKLASTDAWGPSISFPCKWLILSKSPEQMPLTSRSGVKRESLSVQTTDAIRMALFPHIHKFDLTTSNAAEICGISKRTLARKLQARNTSVQREISILRRERAEQILTTTNRQIFEIAAMVGYSDATVFSRAFKRWTGLSPRQYRNNHIGTKQNTTDDLNLKKSGV